MINLLDYARSIRIYKKEIEKLTEVMNIAKERLRKGMIENDKDFIEDGDITVKCTRSYSFDIGMFKMEMPDFSKSFITQETITTTRDIFDKKRLKEKYPDDYAKYNIENTARLTIK